MTFCGMSSCFGLFQIYYDMWQDRLKKMRVNIYVECELKLLSIPHECNLISMAACLPLEGSTYATAPSLRQHLSLGGCNAISDKSTASPCCQGRRFGPSAEKEGRMISPSVSCAVRTKMRCGMGRGSLSPLIRHRCWRIKQQKYYFSFWCAFAC